jgi:hypothetical protein
VTPHFWLVSSARRRAAAVVLACLLLVAVAASKADGDASPMSPTPPSGVANISGPWSGTSDWERNSIHSIGQVTMSIDQDDRTVTGTLTYTSPAYRQWSGSISGTVAGAAPDTQFVGTIELRTPAATGTCVGRATFSGRSVEDALRWETSQLKIASNVEGQFTSSCRELLRNVVLTMGRG